MTARNRCLISKWRFIMSSFFNRITRKENPTIYQNKDGHLKRTLRVRDFLALGVVQLFLHPFSLYQELLLQSTPVQQ